MKYILTEKQFVVLLAVCGIPKLCFFDVDLGLTREELIGAVHILYRDGMIEERAGRYVPSARVSDILSALREGDKILKVTVEDRSIPVRLIYPMKDRTLFIAEHCVSSLEQVVKGYRTAAEEWLDGLFFNELSVMLDGYTEPEEGETIPPPQPEEIEQNGRRIMQAEAVDPDTLEVMRSITVQETAQFCWIILRDAEHTVCCLYREAFLRELLSAEWEGI